MSEDFCVPIPVHAGRLVSGWAGRQSAGQAGRSMLAQTATAEGGAGRRRYWPLLPKLHYSMGLGIHATAAPPGK